MKRTILMLIAVVAIATTDLVNAQTRKLSNRTELVCDDSLGVPGVELMDKLRVIFNGKDMLTVKKMNQETITCIKITSWKKDETDYGDTWIFGFSGISKKAGNYNEGLNVSGYVYIDKKSKITDVGVYVDGSLLQLGGAVKRKDRGKKSEVI